MTAQTIVEQTLKAHDAITCPDLNLSVEDVVLARVVENGREISVISHAEIEVVISRFAGVNSMAVEVVCTGDDPFLDHIKTIWLYAAGFCVEIFIWDLTCSKRDCLRHLFKSKVSKVFFDAKPQLQFLARAFIEVEGEIFDLMLAEQLLTAGILGRPTFDDLCRRYPDSGVSGDQVPKVQKLMSLYPILRDKLAGNRLLGVMDLEMDCLPAIARMEMNGMKVDGYLCGVVKGTLKKELEADPLLKGTLNHNIKFIDRMLNAVNPHTGRIHAHFNQIGAKTGRISSCHPDIQGTPKRSDIRSCFVPELGFVLIRADYSQIELRVMAVMSNDRKMLKIFKEGKDLHCLTASLIMGVPYSKVTESDRYAAKAISLGVNYGMGVSGLIKSSKKNFGKDLSRDEAKLYKDKFLKEYKGVNKMMKNTRKKLNSGDKIAETMIGRKRFWNSEPEFTGLLNTPIQGTAADIIKRALFLVDRALVGKGAKIVGCVHDEIIVEAPEQVKEEVCQLVRVSMINAAIDILSEDICTVDINYR